MRDNCIVGVDVPKIKESGTITSIEGKTVKFEIGKYILLQQSDYKPKYFILQEIFFLTSKGRRKELRFGYYIKGKKPKMRGKWVWGQYAPLIPVGDLRKLIAAGKRAKLF